MPDKIFFSYSHADSAWRERFETMLAPALLDRTVEAWSDQQIQPGSKWRDEIAQALQSTTVAVLLVSPDFLNSPFIQNQELPKLLGGAASHNLTILWVYLRPCMYKVTPVADYQAAHDITKALSQLSRRRQEQVILEICEQIVAACQSDGALGPSLFSPSQAEAMMPVSESLGRAPESVAP